MKDVVARIERLERIVHLLARTKAREGHGYVYSQLQRELDALLAKLPLSDKSESDDR